ncbi:MAG: DUF6199 family natural product biosynthesis protein [Lutispora sp.]|nr:hypothetical protein [Lutispora sp.]MDD4833703.1 hypothetical protein [Lutispora sp.]
MKTIIGFILLFSGGLSAINPEVAWQWEIGWKVKDAEPSDAYLLYTRVVGIVLSIIGLILIFSW